VSAAIAKHVSTMGDDMAEAHQAASDALSGDFLLFGFENFGEVFRVWTGEGAELTLSKLEGAARELLQLIIRHEQDRPTACSECVACQSRLVRVHKALAALADGGMEATVQPLTSTRIQ
jgi:hypothetical protein